MLPSAVKLNTWVFIHWKGAQHRTAMWWLQEREVY
jgi:hypothetical protein